MGLKYAIIYNWQYTQSDDNHLYMYVCVCVYIMSIISIIKISLAYAMSSKFNYWDITKADLGHETLEMSLNSASVIIIHLLLAFSKQVFASGKEKIVHVASSFITVSLDENGYQQVKKIRK